MLISFLQMHIRILTLFFCVSNFYAQSSNNASTDFDNAIGTKNLTFNNGTLHQNSFRSIDDSHRYYNKNEFQIGDLFYDGQLYQNVQLKYDLLTDLLVIKLSGENNKAEFNANSSKIQFFIVNNKRFVNLDFAQKSVITTGFYEETVFANVTLYTKHYKDRIEVLTNKSVFNRYFDKNDFVVRYQDQWHRFDSEQDIVKVFPEAKNTIADFFALNSSLQKSDKNQFTKSLLAHITNFLQINK